jgi:hypothetical protein
VLALSGRILVRASPVEAPIVVAAAESHLAGERSRRVAEEEGIDLEEVHHSRLVFLQTVAEGHRNLLAEEDVLLGVEGSHHVVVDLVEGSPGRSLGPEEGNLRMEVGLEADRMTFAVRELKGSYKVG